MKKLCKTEGCGEHETTEFYVHRNGLYPLCKTCYKQQAKKRKFRENNPKPKCRNCEEDRPEEFHRSKYASSGYQNICKSCRSLDNRMRRLARETQESKEDKLNRIRAMLEMYWIDKGLL